MKFASSFSQSPPIWKSFAQPHDAWQEQLHTLPFDVLGEHCRIVPAGSAGHCNLDSSDNPSCHASHVAYWKDFLSEVLELLHVLPANGGCSGSSSLPSTTDKNAVTLSSTPTLGSSPAERAILALQPKNSKRAYLRVPALKHNQNSTRRLPREGRKKENGGGRGKKARNFGPPTFGAPPTQFGQMRSKRMAKLGLAKCGRDLPSNSSSWAAKSRVASGCTTTRSCGRDAVQNCNNNRSLQIFDVRNPVQKHLVFGGNGTQLCFHELSAPEASPTLSLLAQRGV